HPSLCPLSVSKAPSSQHPLPPPSPLTITRPPFSSNNTHKHSHTQTQIYTHTHTHTSDAFHSVWSSHTLQHLPLTPPLHKVASTSSLSELTERKAKRRRDTTER